MTYTRSTFGRALELLKAINNNSSPQEIFDELEILGWDPLEIQNLNSYIAKGYHPLLAENFRYQKVILNNQNRFKPQGTYANGIYGSNSKHTSHAEISYHAQKYFLSNQISGPINFLQFDFDVHDNATFEKISELDDQLKKDLLSDCDDNGLYTTANIQAKYLYFNNQKPTVEGIIYPSVRDLEEGENILLFDISKLKKKINNLAENKIRTNNGKIEFLDLTMSLLNN